MTTITQKGGASSSSYYRTRTFTYNTLSQLTQITNPESGTTTYTYDADGDVLTRVAPQANQTGSTTTTTSYSYDALNRLLSQSYSDSTPSASYTYDTSSLSCPSGDTCANNGQRTAMSDAAGSEAWTYYYLSGGGTGMSDQRTTNGVTATTTYGFNYGGLVANLTYPSTNAMAYAYNVAAQPTSVADESATYAYGALYTAPGGVSALENGFDSSSPVFWESFYNNRLQPCRVAVNASGTQPTGCSDASHAGNVLDLGFNFGLGTNDNGNVYKVTNNRSSASDRNINYNYDSLNRISAAYTDGSLWGESYTIDPWSNLTGIGTYSTLPAGETLSVSVPGNNNQLNGLCSYETGCYDAAGNLLNDGVNSYTYDAEGRIVGVNGSSCSSATACYVYDGDGKRVEKTTSGSTQSYWYDASGNVLDETTGSTLNNEYVFFNGSRIARRDGSSNVFYYYSDHLGTARSIVQRGDTSPCYDWDFYPYGGEVPHGSETPAFVNSCPQNYKFTGKERDSESGLDYFGARHFASRYMRFPAPDSPGYWSLNDPQTLNLYAYVRNNPLANVDPDGHATYCLGEGLFGFYDVGFLSSAYGDPTDSDDDSEQACVDAGGQWDNEGTYIPTMPSPPPPPTIGSLNGDFPDETDGIPSWLPPLGGLPGLGGGCTYGSGSCGGGIYGFHEDSGGNIIGDYPGEEFCGGWTGAFCNIYLYWTPSAHKWLPQDNAAKLARALNNAGIQSVANPCTAVAFYGASGVAGAVGGAAAGGEAAEAAGSVYNASAPYWRYIPFLARYANTIISWTVSGYNRTTDIVQSTCDAMQP